MIGTLVTAHDAGIYTIAVQVANLVTLCTGVVNMAIGPTIARTYALKDKSRLKYIIKKSNYVIFTYSTAIMLIIILFAKQLLSLFGAEFISASTALYFLLLGQLTNSLAGSTGLILIMTGHEREVVWTGIVSVVINITLNSALIPIFKVNGAAIATAISTGIWPILAAIRTYQILDIDPTIFSILTTKVR